MFPVEPSAVQGLRADLSLRRVQSLRAYMQNLHPTPVRHPA
jgi:hypothetical protein